MVTKNARNFTPADLISFSITIPFHVLRIHLHIKVLLQFYMYIVFMCLAFFCLSYFGTSNRNHLIINCLIMAIRIFKHKYTLYSSHLMIKPCDTFQLMIQCNPVYNCTVPASHLPYRGRTEASLDFILVKSFFRPPVT